MAKSKEPPPRPTRAELDEWARLEHERLDFARKAKNIRSAQAAIEKKALAFAQHEAGKRRPAIVSCCGYQLEVVLARANVKWKDHFIELAGPDQAAELTAAAPTHDEITIHPPAEAATSKAA